MDYKKIYNNLIEYRKNNQLIDGYYENHHIIPKCMGGLDECSNIVRLTAREHYIAHHLLYKIYKTSKLAHAWFNMLRCDSNQKRFFTTRQHEIALKALKDALKISMKGEGNHFFGKSHNEESKKKISIKNKEWHANNKKPKAIIDNWIEKVAKKPKTLEHRIKIGRSNMIMLKNFNTGENIRIHKSDLNNYDKNIWKNPSITQRREKCIHCDIETTVGNIKRWHNNNCKYKGKNDEN